MLHRIIETLKRIAQPESQKAADRWLLILKGLISACLLWYIINKIGAENIIPVMKSSNKGLFFLAAILVVLNLFIQFMKWRLLSHVLLQEDNKKRVFFSLLQGIAAGVFTPARVGEYVGRKFAFPRKGLLEVTIATFIDKLLTLFITVFAGALAAILFIAFRVKVPWFISGALFAAFLFAMLVLAYILLNQHTWHRLAGLTLFRMKFLEPFIERFKMLKRLETRTLMLALAFSFCGYTVFVSQYVLLLQAFDPTAMFLDAYWCGVLMYFTKSAIPSISLGEIGVREMVSVFFAAQFHLSEAAGLNAAFSIFLINIVFPALTGMILFFVKVKDA